MLVRKLSLAAIALLAPLAAGAATCDQVLKAFGSTLADATCFHKGDLTTNGDATSPTWTTFLAVSSIGKLYSDGQNWRVTGVGINGGGTATVYPLDII